MICLGKNKIHQNDCMHSCESFFSENLIIRSSKCFSYLNLDFISFTSQKAHCWHLKGFVAIYLVIEIILTNVNLRPYTF